MLLQYMFTAAFLSLSVNGAAIAARDKSFKFQIDDPKKGKWFLADANGAGTQDASKALTCELTGGVIKCGGKGFADYPAVGDMLKLSTTGNSAGWTIDTEDNIHLTTKPNIKFDVGIGASNDLWAEACPDAHGHFTGQRGTAKAIWV